MQLSRRRLLAGAAQFYIGAQMKAGSLNMPLGVQAYDLKAGLANDFTGTWKALAGFGYRMIDMVSFASYGFPAPLNAMSAKDIRSALEAAGLSCEICHFQAEEFNTEYAKTVAYAHDLGARMVIARPPEAGPKPRTIGNGRPGSLTNSERSYRRMESGLPITTTKMNSEKSTAPFPGIC